MVLVSGPYAPDHKVRLQSNFGDAPRCCCRLRPAERNVTQISNRFQENPETIFQFALPTPLFAFRIQRPQSVPEPRLPRDSQGTGTATSCYKSVIYCYSAFSKLISYQLHRGDSPSVRLPPAIHPVCRSVKRRRR